MTSPVSEHEINQPLPQFIRCHKDDRQCPTCGGRMVRRARQCGECAHKRPVVTHPDDPTKRHIALTRGMVAVVDASDYEWVNSVKWCAHRSSTNPQRYYAVRSVSLGGGKWKFIQMHRLIMGVTDPSIQVDHVRNKETLNNCRDNIRLATPSQNQANREYFENASGYKGVAIVRKKPGKRCYDGWRGEIVIDGKRTVSEIFRDPEPAARWYDAQAVKFFGEFARINFPTE